MLKSSSTEGLTTCVLVIGDSGLGKSTLINMFCGDQAAVSASAEAVTTSCTIYADAQKPNRMWMDTRGWDDSEGTADDDTCRAIMHALQQQRVEIARIIWMVQPGDRCSKSIQDQARFIASMGDFSEGTCVWESTLLVLKKNRLSPFKSATNGAQTAATALGGTSIPAIGYTCIDSLVGDERKEILEDIHDDSPTRRKTRGYLYNKEVKEEVEKRLAALEVVRLVFVEEKCTRCGIVGDNRCVPRGCHTRPRQIHTQPRPFEHTEELAPVARLCNKGHKTVNIQRRCLGEKRCGGCSMPCDVLYECLECKEMLCGEKSTVNMFFKFRKGSAVIAGVGGAAGIGTCGVVAATFHVLNTGDATESFKIAATSCSTAAVLAAAGASPSKDVAKMMASKKCTSIAEVYRCCESLPGSDGCAYACCRTRVGQSDGCCTVCERCRLRWGTRGEAPCDLNSTHRMQ